MKLKIECEFGKDFIPWVEISKQADKKHPCGGFLSEAKPDSYAGGDPFYICINAGVCSNWAPELCKVDIEGVKKL